MGFSTFMILWFWSSILNVWIFQWGKQRLAKAIHGGDGSPFDGLDLAMLILLSLFGSLGVLIGAGMWFEDHKESIHTPMVLSNQRYSRAKTPALKRAGWSEQEISAQFRTGVAFTVQDT